MKYTFNHQNYCNFKIFEENKLKGRAYFIPFKTKKAMEATDIMSERYNSDMVDVLSGEWDFVYYNKLSNMPKLFDTAEQVFDKIQVPSCWQFNGYEKPYYVNQRYQFRPNPPSIPKDIPVAIYRKNITLAKVAPSEIITFLGVCANLELYVNGEYVGYSEGSHNTAEFELAKYLLEGDNEIVALVYKFSNGTYIECQDMFRNNGIFRDVYMTHCGESSVYDYTITTEKVSANTYDLHLFTKVVCEAATVKYTLKLGSKEVAQATAMSDTEISITVENVQEWSAEIPTLYTLFIELQGADGKAIEHIREQVGFKNVRIDDSVLYFNDKNIKIMGVNHHDTDEKEGYVMSVEDMERDVKVMKEFNVNAVRTSHYPPDPIFVKLCNKYGLYVVLEADIEAHGVAVGEFYHPNCVSHNLAWKEHYWDRVKRAYERDKNAPSIFMWSLGNEAGGYACQDYCYDNLKKISDLPIHYEGAIRTARWAYDVISTMYPEASHIHKIAEGKEVKKYYGKPYFMCEYAHAMGVGPGDLDYYVDAFFKGDNMLGGCIWEFCDHAVLHDGNDGYAYKYTYGGDHDEKKHDKNFCVDGLFFPDRTPHTGAYEMKNCYRPIRISSVGGGKYEIKNVRRFLDTSDIIIKWDLLDYGRVIASGEIKEVVLPMMSEVIDINLPELGGSGDNFLIFTYLDKKSGREIAKEQVTISESLGNLCSPSRNVKVVDSQERVAFTYDGGTALFSKKDGALISYTRNQTEYINQSPARKDGVQGFVATIYRAAIDNYMYVDKTWRKQKLDKTKSVFQGYELEEKRAQIKMKYIMTLGNRKAFSYTIKYKVFGEGSMDVKVKLNCNQMFKTYDLPKFGVTLEMPKEFDSVEYYGLGDKENYQDITRQSVMGVYSDKVANMRIPYIKPQDSGNRSNVRYAKVMDKDGNGLKFLALESAFNFNATDVTLDALQNAKHMEDVPPMDTTCVCIDDFVRGIGSNSCGQDTREKFRLLVKKGTELKYKFRVIPLDK